MSSEALTYHIKQLQPNNITDLAILHHAVYQTSMPASFYPKKYDTGYTGVQYTGYIAYNAGGMPVAFYGVIPCFLKHRGKSILSAQSADTMTHPHYRNMGLFVKLANLTFALCKANGIGLLFGFPNQNSLPGFVNKLGWQVTHTMDCFIIPVNRINWEGYFKKLPVLKEIYRVYTACMLKKYTAKTCCLPDNLTDGVMRNKEHQAYKTYNSNTVIQVQKAMIWLKVNNGLIIGDMECGDTDFDMLMQSLLKLARKLGVKQIMVHCSPQTELHYLFKDRYDAIPSFPVIFKDLQSDAQSGHFKFTTADIDTF